MKVNIYADHLAYTLEVGESVYTLGMKFIKKPNENMLPMASAKVNGNTRLMYETSDLEPFQDLKGRVATSDLAIALKSLIDSIKRIEENDFLKINSIDINYQRLFYDKKTNHIRYVVLPVNIWPAHPVEKKIKNKGGVLSTSPFLCHGSLRRLLFRAVSAHT